MEHQQAPLVSDQRQKRRQGNNSTSESGSEAASTGKRQRLHDENGPKTPEYYRALEKEFNEKYEKDPVDVTELDRSDIEEQLRSKSSILVLESAPTWRSHCRAQLCLPRELRGRPNIESNYRFNLLDLTGKRVGEMSWYLQPNRYYHISCIEQILGLPTLIEPREIKIFHQAVEDWFENNGRSFDIAEYRRYDKAYSDWEKKADNREVAHQLHRTAECTCEPAPEEPSKSDYFANERKPRLLSEVLASLSNVQHIDGLPESLLRPPKTSSSDESNDSHGIET